MTLRAALIVICLGAAALSPQARAATESSDTSAETARALSVVQKLASIGDISPANIRAVFHARVALAEAMWSTAAGPKWDLNYDIDGGLAPFRPGYFHVYPTPPFQSESRRAVITLNLQLGPGICIPREKLYAVFPGRITQRMGAIYEFCNRDGGACTGRGFEIDYAIAGMSDHLRMTLESHDDDCADAVFLSQSDAMEPSDDGIEALEYIRPGMSPSDARRILIKKHFSCDLKLVDAPRSGDNQFECGGRLYANADGFRYQTVRVYENPAKDEITAVLFANWTNPPSGM